MTRRHRQPPRPPAPPPGYVWFYWRLIPSRRSSDAPVSGWATTTTGREQPVIRPMETTSPDPPGAGDRR